jgi:hypothetical protein
MPNPGVRLYPKDVVGVSDFNTFQAFLQSRAADPKVLVPWDSYLTRSIDFDFCLRKTEVRVVRWKQNFGPADSGTSASAKLN